MLEEWLTRATEFFVPLFNLMALAVVAYGTIDAFIRSVGLIFRPVDQHRARLVWLQFSRWLVAGLTIQLAADIIETALAPNWEDIGKLAAIAGIRTFLNFFLERDQTELRELDEKRMRERKPEAG
ncbi:DUF1622 domain-containing protein [Devosia sp. ZB163]|uniref:DUF1622 domain-containing protein n=1 Tax=Devosia sp. ZB163 TaxID=3025938 RepID=UPI002360BD20|nr:DUF1622 domain-containing protein [Devosia sp. ZB163]MDC9822314.1 DUF1622 domain-containing protein [Devosia sp. ZB163]